MVVTAKLQRRWWPESGSRLFLCEINNGAILADVVPLSVRQATLYCDNVVIKKQTENTKLLQNNTSETPRSLALDHVMHQQFSFKENT